MVSSVSNFNSQADPQILVWLLEIPEVLYTLKTEINVYQNGDLAHISKNHDSSNVTVLLQLCNKIFKKHNRKSYHFRSPNCYMMFSQRNNY